jgi:predicted nucleotidyltransferase
MSIVNILRDNASEIRDRFGVDRLGVFGSASRGQETPASDVDILVGFEEGKKTFDNFMELKFHLDDLFGRKVDLITFESIHPLMKDRIIKEAVYV